MDCTIYEAKTKVLISCGVTAQQICVFVFAYAKQFSHDVVYFLCIVFDLIDCSPSCITTYCSSKNNNPTLNFISYANQKKIALY